MKPRKGWRMRVWTECYRAFICGGDVNAPISTTVDATGPFELGKEFFGYLVISPWGQTFVAESQSGAFIGGTIEEVRKDIDGCDDLCMMRDQVELAKERAKKADNVDADTFWNLFKRNT